MSSADVHWKTVGKLFGGVAVISICLGGGIAQSDHGLNYLLDEQCD
jgi:hypothetical protein